MGRYSAAFVMVAPPPLYAKPVSSSIEVTERPSPGGSRKQEEAMETDAYPEFRGFTKIPRLYRDIIITEKIDGTNACVYVSKEGEVIAGCRTRWITPEDDNHGFAAWVAEHNDELAMSLPPGIHYGEWWGGGINRGYGLPKGDKRFSLFDPKFSTLNDGGLSVPACCLVVPLLYRGPFDTPTIWAVRDSLQDGGSVAAPGYNRAEGIVIYHTAARQRFKVTIENDDSPKKGGTEDV